MLRSCYPYHGAKGNGARAGVVDGDRVVQARDQNNRAGPEGGRQEHSPDPVASTVLSILTRTRISADHRHESVDKDRGCQDAGTFCPLLPEDRVQDHKERGPCQLVARSNKCCKCHGVGGWSEHVAVNLLPAIIITQIVVLRK